MAFANKATLVEYYLQLPNIAECVSYNDLQYEVFTHLYSMMEYLRWTENDFASVMY